MRYSQLGFFVSELLTDYGDKIIFVVTGRALGSINPFEKGHACQQYNDKVLQLLRSLGNRNDFFHPVHGELVHKDSVRVCDQRNQGSVICNIDALVTDELLLPLVARGADCGSVAFYDTKNHAIALAHMGWSGISLNIAKKVFDRMNETFGTRPENLRVAIGPMIGACGNCCYEVNESVAQHFTDYPGTIVANSGIKFYLNLQIALRQQLQALDIPNIHIDGSGGFCTRCHLDKLFSRRAEPHDTACHAGILALLPKSN